IDPPLHEFLRDIDMKALAKVTGLTSGKAKAHVVARRAQLEEENPMLGLRGCRLLLVFPEILEMQIRAILGAAADVAAKGVVAKPEIMMPLVGTMGELERLHKQVYEVAAAVEK